MGVPAIYCTERSVWCGNELKDAATNFHFWDIESRQSFHDGIEAASPHGRMGKMADQEKPVRRRGQPQNALHSMQPPTQLKWHWPFPASRPCKHADTAGAKCGDGGRNQFPSPGQAQTVLVIGHKSWGSELIEQRRLLESWSNGVLAADKCLGEIDSTHIQHIQTTPPTNEPGRASLAGHAVSWSLGYHHSAKMTGPNIAILSP